MAVHVVSLERLEGARARCLQREAPPDPAVLVPSSVANPTGDEITDGGRVTAAAVSRLSGADAGTDASAGEITGGGKSQADAPVSESGEFGSKAMLALIYRLGAIEAQLAEWPARLGGVSAAVPTPAAVHPSHHGVRHASTSQLLEQVFHKNLSLRGKE